MSVKDCPKCGRITRPDHMEGCPYEYGMRWLTEGTAQDLSTESAQQIADLTAEVERLNLERLKAESEAMNWKHDAEDLQARTVTAEDAAMLRELASKDHVCTVGDCHCNEIRASLEQLAVKGEQG